MSNGSRLPTRLGGRLGRHGAPLPSARLALCGPALVIVLALALLPAAAGRAATSIVYAQHPCTMVYNAPSGSARPLTQLMGGNELTQVGAQRAADGTSWAHVKLWSGLDAYVPAADVSTAFPGDTGEGTCTFLDLPDTQPDPLLPSPGPWPLAVSGTLIVPTAVLATPSRDAFPIAAAELGRPVQITAWAAESDGTPWYQVAVTGGSGWVRASAVRLDQPNPADRAVNGVPLAHTVAGKGMSLFKNYLPHHSDVEALVQAATLAGLTHLYTEVAISVGALGFYARSTLDRLLPVAHAAGIKVISTVYPALDDVATDARPTAEVADYRTPTNSPGNGIAMDVEAVTTADAVYAYGQLVRALVGPDRLMVALVFHPLSHVDYPYGAIAASWNVISPMDYWYSDVSRKYAPADTVRFVTTSITTIRAAVGPEMPIEELGQTYVEDRRYSDGVAPTNAPTASETIADLQTARRLGCIGISFYSWQAATQAEWQAVTDTHW